MKKVLAILASLSLGITAPVSVIACGFRASESNDTPNVTPPPVKKADIGKIDDLKFDLNKDDEAKWDSIEKYVKATIEGLNKDAIVGEDYNIQQPQKLDSNGKPATTQKLLVAATETSSRLEGFFYIEIIIKFNIIDDKDLNLPEHGNPDNPNESEQIKDRIREEIKKKYPDAVEGIDYEFVPSPSGDGSWIVRGLPGRGIEIDYEYSYKKESIAVEYTGQPVIVKDTKTEYDTKISQWIRGINRLATVGKDYEIKGDTFDNRSFILVNANPASKYLKDSIKIPVKEVSIDVLDEKITNISVLAKEFEIVDVLHKEINNLKVGLSVDHSKGHFMLDPQDGWTTIVRAVAGNHQITGTFSFIQQQVDISGLSNKIKAPGIKPDATEAEIRRIVTPEINKLLVYNNEQRATIIPGSENERNYYRLEKHENQWKVIATSIPSNLLKGEFDLNLEKTSIASLGEKFNGLTSSLGDAAIREKINQEINDLVSANSSLTDGVDYEIVDEKNKPILDLGKAGTVIVKAIDTGYIEGQFSFAIIDGSIGQMLQHEFGVITTTQTEKSVEDQIKTAFANRFADNTPVLGIDYEISAVENWENDRGVEIKALDDSKIISGSIKVEIKTFNFETELNLGSYKIADKYSIVENDVKGVIAEKFKNSWMATPVLGRDYKIYGFNADGDGKILTRSGSMGLYVKPTTNSLLLTGRANINVGEIVTSAASGVT